ncbi:maltooligosyl trehalose hydrolase [Geodermatophilus siccatus]|uniref:Malto-oligosyltrehalose trehalohydrolase n=1 Tax=Geodermatophilus siccatus TaxID=1137991 RepID=A0A1G9RLN5_9ACTN|nr:malto-oligosyltrehalose trehalohydrolase [Geodermatophilus siccatus]SDM24148.1 maltooligosyl trehalose hydrolase [Geodermatophilus siccatus]
MSAAVEFAVWAPVPERVRLQVEGSVHEMRREEGGWWRAEVEAGPEADYGFLLGDDDTPRPDPRSRRQPEGVHGLSRCHDPASHEWGDHAWTGRPLAGGVVYEMHVGTFTPEGTLDAAIGKLDHLVDLGVDFVELLPVNGFDGTHNWGYDGVLWYAVQENYGGPAAYQRFVDACHQRGLGVLQDVVYNHLGPSGNYLPLFMPIFSEGGANTWGSSVNLSGPDSDEVRRYILDNALMWLRDMHVDGLRLDAVHALVDERATHVLEEMAQEVDRLSVALGRPLTLIAESDLNDPRMVTPRVANGTGIHAQWSDDFHHALHSVLTGEGQGYYGDFAAAGLSGLAKTLTGAYFHDGTWSSFRRRHHGRPVDTALLPGWKFLGYLQDHDQIGNRAVGDRVSASLSPGLLAVGATLVLTSPFTPMLFMGEEWGASTPWQFFTSHTDPEIGRATAEGRKGEFAEHGWDADEVPDPQDPETFTRSKLDWSEVEREPHARLLATTRALLALRRQHPDLVDPDLSRVEVAWDDEDRWLVVHRGALRVVANLSGDAREVDLDRAATGVLLATGDEPGLAGTTVTMPAESAAVLTTAGRQPREHRSERQRARSGPGRGGRPEGTA